MLDKAKKIAKIFFYTIILLICFFGIVPLFINFLVNTTNPFGIGFINEENKDTWINFFGTIIGGGLTLLGVWWTIKDSNNQRHEDLVIQYKPLFELQNITLEKDITDPMLRLAFDIQNIGRGEAHDFKIECNKDLFNSEDEEQNNCFKKDIILAGDTVWSEFYIQITDSDSSKNIIIKGHDMRDILYYNIIITITYSNMFHKTYEQLVHIPASYNKTEDKCRINYQEIFYKYPEE